MIIRTYACPECNHYIEVALASDEWDRPPPACSVCEARMHQEWKAPGTLGNATRAMNLAQKIAEEDYGVTNYKSDGREGGVGKATYKDQRPSGATPSNWVGANREMLEGAISLGRQSRLKYGSGLDVLEANLKSGAQPDLIEMSKRKAMKVW